MKDAFKLEICKLHKLVGTFGCCEMELAGEKIMDLQPGAVFSSEIFDKGLELTGFYMLIEYGWVVGSSSNYIAVDGFWKRLQDKGKI